MSTTEREAHVAHWLELTRRTLPAMAAAHDWPVRLDHCFMRICLDAALGSPWTRAVPAPAIRNMSDAELEAAIEVAERCAAEPALLPELDRQSLAARRRVRLAA